MLLQGFPDSYVLKGTLSQQLRLVSDTVPPPLAYALAGSIYRAIAGLPTTSGQSATQVPMENAVGEDF
jgi:DNA (cytosine-5)-methyltransferase 1